MKKMSIAQTIRTGGQILILATVLGADTLTAAVTAPSLMSFQGYLTDANGNPLTTNNAPKNYDLVFRVWDQATGGVTNSVNELYAERQTATVNNGYFSVQLGQGVQYNGEPYSPGNLASYFFTNSASGNTGRYMETTILGVGPNNGPITIAPRMACLSTPYAFMAANANNAVNLVNAAGVPLITPNSTNLQISIGISGAGANYSGLVQALAISVTNSISAPTINVTNVNATGTITASNYVGFGTIPLGGIIMWNGVTPPAGWALCNGQTTNGYVTPDLQSRFVLGAGSGSGLTARTVGGKGGEESHTLTYSEMPSHAHNLSVGTVGYTAGWGGAQEATKAPYQGQNNGWQNYVTDYQGGNQPHNTMPPYYVLAFIMRIQ